MSSTIPITAPTLVTVPEAMSILRVSRATIYNLINQGAFPVVKIGGTRFRFSDLNAYIQHNTIRKEPS